LPDKQSWDYRGHFTHWLCHADARQVSDLPNGPHPFGRSPTIQPVVDRRTEKASPGKSGDLPRIREAESQYLRHSKKSRKILARNTADFLRLPPVQRRQTPRRLDHPRRLISPSAKRHRRQVGAISLNQQAIKRKLPGNVAQVFSLLEGQIAGKRDVETQVERLARHLQTAAETMHDGGWPIIAEFLAQNADRVVVGCARV